MKALVVDMPYEMAVKEVDEVHIQDAHDVKIKVISGGICGSDIGIYTGSNPFAVYPRIIGHEFGGEVVEVGSAVTKVKVGDVVAVDPVRSCGHCYACTHGRHNVCKDLQVVGVHVDGGFAQYALSPEANVYPLDTTKVARELASMVEPYSIGVQVNHRANVTADDTVLVIGCGPVGICAMEVAKARGAKVMMSDLLDERLARALDMGADRVVNVQTESLEEAVSQFTDGEGPNVIVDCICTNKSFPQALELVSTAGRVVPMSLSSTPCDVAPMWITKKEISIIGTRVNNYCFEEVISLMESHAIHPEKLCTQLMPYGQVHEALDMIKEQPGAVCKIILDFTK